MTSTERAALESGYNADGTAYGFHIPAGTRVAVKLKSGKWVWHVTKEDIVTGRGMTPTNADHPIDPRMTRDIYDIGTMEVKGLEVQFIRKIEYYGTFAEDMPKVEDVSFKDHPCLCGGKGELYTTYFGGGQQTSRVKCGKRCTWRKPRRK